MPYNTQRTPQCLTTQLLLLVWDLLLIGMNNFEYYLGHCFQTGWREMWNNFKMWRDLLSNNYSSYAILSEDDPYQECYNWFWTSINLDECYSKEFLEYLQQLMKNIDSGKEKLIPMDEDFMAKLEQWGKEEDT